VTFSESSLWISGEGSDATADAGIDETLWVSASGEGSPVDVNPDRPRGGFRYLSLVHNSTGNVEVNQITVNYNAMPHWQDDELREYTGYFHSSDELINRIWYAGAYTNQLCTVPPDTGDALIHLGEDDEELAAQGSVSWGSNTTISNGSSVLTDGAKRDRLVWAGDMAIAVPAITVTTYDLISIENSLDSLFGLQNATGQLPYAGVGFRLVFSSTYHLYTLIGVADHYLYSGDIEYLQGKWDAWKLAMNYSLSSIDDSGMMNVTSSADWLRFGMGGHNIEANSILYYTLNQGIALGQALNESSGLLDSWAETAERIKEAANTRLWNATTGLYHDNETTTLSPQDGNCWAVVANLTDSADKNTAISEGLHNRWTDFGAPAVEADRAVSPFISGFELQMHLLADDAQTALDLMRLEWGFMLDDPRMTNSTFIEGYQDDGVLHYAPYKNDPRISHAHGWATGPTSTLTFYIGGLHLLSSGGQTWEYAPRLGGLTDVDTGFRTNVGDFASTIVASESGDIQSMTFTTPDGTSGSVDVPGVEGILVGRDGTSVELVDGRAATVRGGTWTLRTSGNSTSGGNGTATTPSMPPEQTGNAASAAEISTLALIAGLLAWVM